MATTLRDALSASFDSVETDLATETPDSPAEATLDIPEPFTGRDDSGRFAPKPKEQETPETPQEVTEDQPVTRKPPSSWKKDMWGHWEKIPDEAKSYVEQREQEYAKGVSTYRAEAEKARSLQDAIAPFIPDMERFGVRPEEEVRNLLSAHHTLVTATPQQKLQMFTKLATDYGVPLQALYQGQTGQPSQGDPQFSALLQEVNALKSQYGQMYTSQEQREAAAAASQIESFKAQAPHFDAVRPTMAGLLQSGMATDLQSAYDKAIRLHDDIWQQEQASQAKAAKDAQAKALAAKRATAVSPRSTAPTGVTIKGNGKDLRSVLSSAFGEAEAGRL